MTMQEYLPLQPFVNLVRFLRYHFAWVESEPLPWKSYALIMTWSQWTFETFLLARQYPYYSKATLPPHLASHSQVREKITEETLRKSQDYSRHRALYEFAVRTCRQLVNTGLIYYDVFPLWWRIGGDFASWWLDEGSYSVIVQSMAFEFQKYVFSMAIQICFSYFETFWLEAYHGFNKTTPGLFVSDRIKASVIGWLLHMPFQVALLLVFDRTGEAFVPGVMMSFITFQILVIILNPLVIQPLFNKLTPFPDNRLKERIESMVKQYKFPLAKLYVIDGSKRSDHSNAYMYGLPWSKHIVVFDTLLDKSTEGEVLAIVGHELGHWYYNHPAFLLAFVNANILFLITAFAVFQHAPPLLLSFRFPKDVANQCPSLVAFHLFHLVTAPATQFIVFGVNVLTRRCEYAADAFAARLRERTAEGGEDIKGQEGKSMGVLLADGLVSIHEQNLSALWLDWMYSAFYRSHPSLIERLKALEAIELDYGKKAL